MFASRIALQAIPGVQFLGLFIASITVAYRKRALIPLYVYVLLEFMFAGFATWLIPYTYIWLPLWAMFMLAGGKALPKKVKVPLYMVLCGLFGLAFGTLYAPVQAVLFGMNFRATVAWIIAGLPVDAVHAANNFVMGSLILPLSEMLKRLDGRNKR
jgi:energy-coupling factor transport system substrate-specific component